MANSRLDPQVLPQRSWPLLDNFSLGEMLDAEGEDTASKIMPRAGSKWRESEEGLALEGSTLRSSVNVLTIASADKRH